MKYLYPISIVLFYLLPLSTFSQSFEEKLQEKIIYEKTKQKTKEKIKEGYELCDSLSKLATSIMQLRQSGKPQKTVMAVVKGLGADAAKIVEFAYDYPLQKTEKERKDVVLKFSELIKASCRKSVLNKLKPKS